MPSRVNGYDQEEKIDRLLGPELSSGASIVHDASAAPRWSDYHAPCPGTIVNVAEEADVQNVVQYCIKNGLDFLAQSGGHGWATTFDMGKKGIVINMRGLNKVSVSSTKDSVTIGGGAIYAEVLKATFAEGVQSVIGGCNSVGVMGAVLGGGLARLMGLYGMGVDNLLSVNLVTASGSFITVTPKSDPDLWFAIRGAGANFGIVTSATMKAYPIANNGTVWSGNLIYRADQLEAVASTINTMSIPKEGCILVYFAGAPPDFNLTIIVNPFFNGPMSAGRAAFAPLLAIGPIVDTTAEVPYSTINDDADFFGTKGDRKPSWTVGLKQMDPKTLRKVWDEYLAFQARPEFRQATMLIECYSYDKTREVPDSASAFPHRRVNFHADVIQWYRGEDLDEDAVEFGEKVRSILREGSGFEEARSYINFSHGDEGNEVIYGENLDRLKQLKKQYDPDGRFNQFFALE